MSHYSGPTPEPVVLREESGTLIESLQLDAEAMALSAGEVSPRT